MRWLADGSRIQRTKDLFGAATRARVITCWLCRISETASVGPNCAFRVGPSHRSQPTSSLSFTPLTAILRGLPQTCQCAPSLRRLHCFWGQSFGESRPLRALTPVASLGGWFQCTLCRALSQTEPGSRSVVLCFAVYTQRRSLLPQR